jgi:hypothetical protein
MSVMVFPSGGGGGAHVRAHRPKGLEAGQDGGAEACKLLLSGWAAEPFQCFSVL